MKTGILRRHRTVLSLFACVWCAVAGAQSTDAPSVELPETEVTATRSPQLLSAALAHTTVISREDIAQSQAVDLVTLLEREAGLQRIQNGGVGTVSGIFMRGSAALQTLILIDGVPQNKQDASGTVSLEQLMLDNIERVEIVRGNVSAIYGSGAISGVVQIFTRDGARQPSTSLASEIGPRNSQRLDFETSGSAGDNRYSAGLSRTTTDGFSAVNTAQFPSANPDNDGYQNTSAHLSLSRQLAPGQQVGIQLSQSTGDAQYDNYFGAPTDLQSSTTSLRQATLYSANRWGSWNSRVNLSLQSDHSVIRDNGQYGSIDAYTTETRLLSWVNTVSLGDVWSATGGLEAQAQHVDTASSSPYNTPYAQGRDTSAWFAGVQGEAAGAELQLNLRHDRVGALSQNTGYLGLGYALGGGYKAIASASSAFNAPPLGYLYAPGYGNPNLKPELAQSREFGLQYAQGTQLLRLTYFDTRIDDQLNYDPATFTFANIARTHNQGLELSYRAHIGDTQWRASLTSQDPTDADTGVLLLRRAQTLAALGCVHQMANWTLGANLRYSGARDDAYSDPNTFANVPASLAPYTVLDLTVAYRWSPALRLTARLDNASDANYQTVYGYNQQPRSLYAGVVWSPLH